MSEPSTFDERLAEIDRRLRTIQSDLHGVPEAAEFPPPRAWSPDPGATVPSAEVPAATVQAATVQAAPAGDLAARLERISEALERLLVHHSELLSRCAEALSAAAPAGEPTVTASAGPFADAESVRAFTRALEQLPQVAGVAVREYGAGGQVSVDVRLNRAVA